MNEDFELVRVAMWSGPRNISTAMMRAFENRPDTCVIDEPFYSVYLDRTGADHPMRAESLASQSTNWRRVVAELLESAAGGICGLLPEAHDPPHGGGGRPGLDGAVPQRLPHPLARAGPGILCRQTSRGHPGRHRLRAAGGVVRDRSRASGGRAAGDRRRRRAGRSAPRPRRTLRRARHSVQDLDAEVAGRPTDERWGLGARSGMARVEQSTGFAAPPTSAPVLDERLSGIAEAARPYYEKLAQYRLAPAPTPVEGRGESS